MGKNRNQHYVSAFYLYNFTNDQQKEESKDKKNRETKIFHVDIKKDPRTIKERAIKNVATEPYLLSFKDSSNKYVHKHDDIVKTIEHNTAISIKELASQYAFALKKKPSSIKIKNSIFDNIIDLLLWQIKMHPEIINEFTSAHEKYLIDQGETPTESKQKSLEVIKNMFEEGGDYDLKSELKKKNKIIVCTSNPNAHFITTDKPFVRYNAKGNCGVAVTDTEMYFPLTSNMLLFMCNNGDRKELQLENDLKFLRGLNVKIAQKAKNFIFSKNDRHLTKIVKQLQNK